MTEFILVRHAEPSFDEVKSKGYRGQAQNFAKLTEKGILQAKEAASHLKDEKVDLIISSPYTRALETAAILSRTLDVELRVENDLHEWIVDKTFNYQQTTEDAYLEFMADQGKKHAHHKGTWETFDELKKRVDAVLAKYQRYGRVIVVCHAFVIATQTSFDKKIPHGGYCIIEK